MAVPNYEKRRPPQDPLDGKGPNRYSDKVRSATDSMESDDVQDFDRQGYPGKPHREVEPPIMDGIDPIKVISNFSRLGDSLKDTAEFRKMAVEIAKIAEMAESTVMQEAGDWFDGHTIKRNMKELKGHAGAFNKIAEELDNLHQRATALYDDMGNVLARYFEMSPGMDSEGEPFDGKKAPEFDGPGGNPTDDAGRKKHDAQDGVIGDVAPLATGDAHTTDIHPGDDSDEGDGDIDDEEVETITDAVMARIIPERGEDTPEAARKALRTPKSFARPHQHMTHDQAKDILKKTGAKTVGEAHKVMEAVSSVQLKKREAAIRQIVQQHQAAKIDGVLVDAFTASGLVKMLDNLNPQNKTRFLGVSIEQMADIMWKVLKKK